MASHKYEYRVIHRGTVMTNPGTSRKDAQYVVDNFAYNGKTVTVEKRASGSYDWQPVVMPPSSRNRAGRPRLRDASRYTRDNFPMPGEQRIGPDHQLRESSGQYAVGLDAMCVCGHSKGVHVAGNSRGAYECINHEVGDGTDCDCVKFKAARKSANRSGARLATKSPSTMSAAAINNELDRLGSANTKLADEFIAAGRGYETREETYRRRDPLAMKFNAITDRISALRNEVERRAGPGVYRLPKGFGPLR